MKLNCLVKELILRQQYNVTGSYRYCYKTITNIEKGFVRAYNDSISKLYTEVQQWLNKVNDTYSLENSL